MPFYFCPRSVMLYVISRTNHPELSYRGGQGPIIHLEADLRRTVAWAEANDRRWAFTSSNAGASYFEDYDDLGQLRRLAWEAIQAWDWRGRQEGKQAEFLVEGSFPWEPGGGPADDRTNRSKKAPNMTRGRAALIGLMDRYLRGLLDPFVTLLEIHKLLYFMEKADEPLSLGFEKGYYGPYAERLRHVLRQLEGHLISGYEDGGDTPAKQIELVPGAVEEAATFLERYPRTKERLARVSDLVEGFESSFGLELLATVHWVASERPSGTEDEIVYDTHAWSPHKRQFSGRQIKLALNVLRDKGWLETASPA